MKGVPFIITLYDLWSKNMLLSKNKRIDIY